MNRYFLLLCLNSVSLFSFGQNLTGSCNAQVRILTDRKDYEFESKVMDGRLNDVMERFEFSIPVSSMKSLNDSSDLKFLQRFVNGGQTININAILPDDKSPQLDLSYFKGNQSINLAAEIKIGTSVFEDDIDFNGMLINGDQGLAFNFNVFLNDRELSFMKVGEEKILEIEITAKGDKISGITTIR